MSASSDEWLEGMEEMLTEDENLESYLHFVSDEVPDYMFEHWQNMYELKNEDYFTDVGMYAEGEIE